MDIVIFVSFKAIFLNYTQISLPSMVGQQQIFVQCFVSFCSRNFFGVTERRSAVFVIVYSECLQMLNTAEVSINRIVKEVYLTKLIVNKATLLFSFFSCFLINSTPSTVITILSKGLFAVKTNENLKESETLS